LARARWTPARRPPIGPKASIP